MNKPFKIGLALLSIVSVALAIGLIAPKKAAAATITQTAPMAGSGTITGTSNPTNPWFAVGTGEYNGKFSYAKVYINTTTTLHVVHGGGDCAPDIGSSNVLYEVYALDANEANPSQILADSSNHPNCQDVNFTLNPAASAVSSKTGHGAYHVFVVKVTMMTPDCGTSACDNEKNFRLRVDNGLVGVSRGIFALGGKPWFGIYQRDAPSYGGNNWNWSVQFAPYCDEDIVISDRTIGVYDIDWKVYTQPNLLAKINQDLRTNVNPSWSLANVYPGDPNPPDRFQDGFAAGDHSTNNLGYSSNADYRYQLLFQDVNSSNTIQITLPYDQFDSQNIVGQACKPPPKDVATCSVLDKNVAAGQSTNLPVTFTNTSSSGNVPGQSTWTGLYKIIQTQPSSASLAIPSPPVAPGGSRTINVSVPGQASGFKLYTFHMANASGVSFGQTCTAKITWNSSGGVSCTAIATNPGKYPAVGANTDIVLTVYNNGVPNLQGDQIRQKPSDTANTGQVWPASGFGNFTPGQSLSHTFTVTRGSATTVTFTYILFSTNDASGVPVSGVSNPLNCPVTISWGGTTPGQASISVACDYTTVSNMNVPATWHAPAPAGTPVALRLPSDPSRLATSSVIGNVPVQLTITDDQTGESHTFNLSVPNFNGTSAPISTFSLWNQAGAKMWPQNSYSILLSVQGANTPAEDSTTYNNDGAWGYYSTKSDFSSGTGHVDSCLSADCGNPSNGIDAEPGQNRAYSYTVNFHNQTAESYATNDGAGYHFSVQTQGGFRNVSGASTNTQINPRGDTTVTVSFTATVDYTGQFGVTLEFQGSGPLDLPGLPGGSCNEGNDTPSTRPFLQVWGGDINTGGGFETQDPVSGAFSCSGQYPDYVSPSATNLPGGNASDYGGLKTFGASTGAYGSLSDFGALSLGVIAKNDLAFINFGAQPKFSNTSSPAGQLNSTPPDYCITDFFGTTQKTPPPQPMGSAVQLSDLSGSPTGQYIVSNQNIDNFVGGTVASGSRITLYVDGDITITSPITYDNWSDPNNPDTAPSFTIVAKGNINLGPNVNRLDGLYIAQPTSSGNDGVFNDCADNSGNQFCNKQLVVNGAVIARLIKPLRSAGTLAPDACPAFINNPCNPAAPTYFHKPAEIFNYIPSMVINSPNFSPSYNSLQGLFNLPPVF